MRLVSNKESIARGEVSLLAIVETPLAIALVFYLSAHLNTLRWLAVAMFVSPLLLLRTEESTQRGIDWFRVWTRYVGRRVERTSNTGLFNSHREHLSLRSWHRHHGFRDSGFCNRLHVCSEPPQEC